MSVIIDIESGVSSQGVPFVTFVWSRPKTEAQLTPAQARQEALDILATADAAESDAFLVGWFRESGTTESLIAAALQKFRIYRTAGRKP